MVFATADKRTSGHQGKLSRDDIMSLLFASGLKDSVADALAGRIVGKTNLHELAFGVTGLNDWTGTAPNPLFPVAAQEKKDAASDDDNSDDSDDDDDGIVADGGGGFETTTKMTAAEREEARKASERRRKARREAKRAKKKEEEFPLEVEPADLGLHLRAHFYIARMHGKLLALPTETGEARVKGLRGSLKK